MSGWEPTPPTGPVAFPDPDGAVDDEVDDGFDDGFDDELVRPFVITGGRTRHATVHMRVEALVVSTGSVPARDLQFEHAAIVEVCASPVSVAEVAARVGVPLGVAQILVGDLAEAGLVQVHEARQVATPALLLRMIDAVRAL